MQANVDNTIGRFRSAMAAAEGYARPSRFAIRVFPPVNLEDQITHAQRATYNNGQVNSPQQYDGVPMGDFDNPPSGKYMNDLLSTYGRSINIHCDSVVMPTKQMQSQEVQYGSEPVRSMVQTHEFPGTITASFYADKYLRERSFFEAWQKMCVGEHTHKANYYDSYIGKMHIYQLGADGEVSRDMPTYAVEAMEVYPQQIGSIEYGYGKTNEVAKVTIGFAYKQWRNMATETTGIEFGHSQQTAANIKARTPGLLDRLPPDLKRAAGGIIAQGRTVLNPVGRIFKGKVFPPFT